VARRVAQFIAIDGNLDGLNRLHAAYAAITPADVQAAAQRYLSSQRRTVGVLRTAQ
jgi:predicted Zn-dependent peptidase